MGHVRLGNLARTRKWNQVVALIECGASAPQIASASILAAEKALRLAVKDTGVVHTIWLFMQLPSAAREESFVDALRQRGLNVTKEPGLAEILGAMSDAIDSKMPNCRGRSDLGEMAQMAAVETIGRVIGERSRTLFGTTTHEVQSALAASATVKQFSHLAREFFARFTNKCLGYFLSRTMAQHVGDGRRFVNLAQQAEFTRALETHCYEAAEIVERFSGEWLSTENHRKDGHVTPDDVKRFTSVSMDKLVAELQRGARDHE